MRISIWVFSAVFLGLCVFCAVAGATPTAEQALYEETKSLLDNYNGRRGELVEAKKLTEKLLEMNPDSPLGLINLGRLHLYFGYINYQDFDQTAVFRAQSLFAQVQEVAPALFDAWLFGAYASMLDETAKGLRGAKIMAAEAEKLAPESPRTNLLFTQIARNEKNDGEVLRRARQVLAKTEEPWMVSIAHMHLSRVFRKQKNFELADQSHRKILELDPDSPWANINYAEFLTRRGDYDGAIGYGEKALLIMDFGMGHKILGKAYYKKGADLHWKQKEREKSRDYFLQAIKHAPAMANAHYGLGMSYYHTGYYNKSVADLKRSEEALEQVLQINPAHEQAREQLRALHKLLGAI